MVLPEEVLETRADSFELLEGRGRGPGDDRRTANRVALAGDVDLEINRRARRVVAESPEEHAGFRNVLGLAKGTERSFLEVEDDPRRCAKGEARRNGRQLGNGEGEELVVVVGGYGAVDSDADKRLRGVEVLRVGKQNHSALLACGARRPDAVDEAAERGDRTGKTDDDGVEFLALDALESVVVPGFVVDLNTVILQHGCSTLVGFLVHPSQNDLSFHDLFLPPESHYKQKCEDYHELIGFFLDGTETYLLFATVDCLKKKQCCATLRLMTADGFPLGLGRDVPLAPLTSLEIGGPASFLIEAETEKDAVEAVAWSRRRQCPLAVLGSGTNLVVSDNGWDGLVLKMALSGVDISSDGGTALVAAAAGEVWDELVEMTVAANLAGLECLSGIPGSVGATPIQNVGAYGQEVGSLIESVRVLDLDDLEIRELPPSECGFGYRTSHFRRNPGKYLVLAVMFRLRKDGPAPIAYRELREALEVTGSSPGPLAVREAVLHLRRGKSMVLDDADPNRRSVGSFFVNPAVDAVEFEVLQTRARAAGVVVADESVPSFDMDDGKFKVPAGWLVEKAGFAKGLRQGRVGVSTAHALALVHHGGGSASELLQLAKEIRGGVFATFGILLRPEPVFLGFSEDDPLGS